MTTSLPAARGGMRGSTKTALTGLGLLALSLALFVVFLVLAIATDNRYLAAQGLVFVGSLLSGAVGVLATLAGVALRLWAHRREVLSRDVELIAAMGRARTPQQAAQVQARATSRSWLSWIPVASFLCLLCAAVLPLPGLVRLGVALVGGVALGAVLLAGRVPRRRGGGWLPGQSWTPGGTVTTMGSPGTAGDREPRTRNPEYGGGPAPPPAVLQRIQDEHTARLGTRNASSPVELFLHAAIGTSVARSDTAILWAWHHPTLFARETMMADLARDHGWTFQLAHFGIPASGTARHVLTGTRDGSRFTAFDDIRDEIRRRKDSRVADVMLHAAATVDIPFAAPFRLAVVRDTFGATVKWGHIGHQVDLESGAFNDAYNVYCIDPVRARITLNPKVMAALLDHPGVELVIDRGHLRLTRTGGFATAETWTALVDLAAAVARSARSAAVS